MTKPVSQKLSKETKCAVSRAFGSINDDICEHKAKYFGIFVLHGLVLSILCQQALFGLAWWPLMVTELVLIFATAKLMAKASKRPGRLMREWALQENQQITIATLQGKNSDELEKLLEYHMSTGNLEAADRISQKLINIAAGVPDNDPIPVVKAAPATLSGAQQIQQIAQKPDDGVLLKLPAGTATSNLPGWMQTGTENKTAAEDEQQQQSSLPDWMKS